MSKKPEENQENSNNNINKLHNDIDYQQKILNEHNKTDKNGEPITQEEIDQMRKIEEEERSKRYR